MMHWNDVRLATMGPALMALVLFLVAAIGHEGLNVCDCGSQTVSSLSL